MLKTHELLRHDALTVNDVACCHERGRGEVEEYAGGPMLVFVRRGCFVRSADGVVSTLDPTVAYTMMPGEEQRHDHPHDGGDDCTGLAPAPEILAGLWGGDPTLPRGVMPTTPDIDLAHRRLVAGASRGADPEALVEASIDLIAQALSRSDAGRVASGRPATERARRMLVDGVREALAAAPERTLVRLARDLAVSPHHLSRVFRAGTGETIARHRMRLRTRAVLERLAGGEGDLARMAADLGFADQAHLCRVVRDETGRTPSSLRDALAVAG
jgi:AraC-like DNA-binding protein